MSDSKCLHAVLVRLSDKEAEKHEYVGAGYSGTFLPFFRCSLCKQLLFIRTPHPDGKQ